MDSKTNHQWKRLTIGWLYGNETKHFEIKKNQTKRNRVSPSPRWENWIELQTNVWKQTENPKKKQKYVIT